MADQTMRWEFEVLPPLLRAPITSKLGRIVDQQVLTVCCRYDDGTTNWEMLQAIIPLSPFLKTL